MLYDVESWERTQLFEVFEQLSPTADHDTKHDDLAAIIAALYRANSERAVQSRRWAARVVEELTVEGLAMDD
jgi:hypothetical protein